MSPAIVEGMVLGGVAVGGYFSNGVEKLIKSVDSSSSSSGMGMVAACRSDSLFSSRWARLGKGCEDKGFLEIGEPVVGPSLLVGVVGDETLLVGEAGSWGTEEIDLDRGADLIRGTGGTVAGAALVDPPFAFDTAALAPGRIWEYEDRSVDGRPGEEDSTALAAETCLR
jgi:hypothetical protein